MLDALPLLDRLSFMANHAGARHRLLAENIAQANTPGYRAHDLAPFAEMMARDAPGAAPGTVTAARMTRPGHADAAQSSVPSAFVPREIDAPAAPNGNSVIVEEQMLRAAEAESQHRLALRLYAKSAELMRLGLGRLR